MFVPVLVIVGAVGVVLLAILVAAVTAGALVRATQELDAYRAAAKLPPWPLDTSSRESRP